jgi:hypothetical protein
VYWVVWVFIVLGLTSTKRDSRAILGRNQYKSLEELRDIYAVNRLRRGVLKSERIYVFRVVDSNQDSWFLVSFDIKRALGKRSGKYRKPTREYSAVKEYMYSNLCGRVDMSTYICPESVDLDTQLRALGVPNPRVEYYYVVPHDGKALEFLRDSITRTINYLYTKLLTLISKVEKCDRRAVKLRKAAESALAEYRSLVELVVRYRSKLDAIGVDTDSLISSFRSECSRLESAVKSKWGGGE